MSGEMRVGTGIQFLLLPLPSGARKVAQWQQNRLLDDASGPLRRFAHIDQESIACADAGTGFGRMDPRRGCEQGLEGTQ